MQNRTQLPIGQLPQDAILGRIGAMFIWTAVLVIAAPGFLFLAVAPVSEAPSTLILFAVPFLVPLGLWLRALYRKRR
jgi:hypothetical protein